jgi:methionyl-tRNA synthetase
VTTLIVKDFASVLPGTAGRTPDAIVPNLADIVAQIRTNMDACQYNFAIEKIVQQILVPANQYIEKNAPWKLVKTDKDAARPILFNLAEILRVAAILLKPVLVRSAETIYRSFNFSQPWETVRYADACAPPAQGEDLRVVAALVNGKVPPLFPVIN